MILQPAEEVVLGLLVRGVEADLGRDELSEQLGELPQLQQRGVRVVSEVALRKHAQAHELLIAPVYYRLLLTGRPLTATFAKRNVEAVMRAFAP